MTNFCSRHNTRLPQKLAIRTATESRSRSGMSHGKKTPPPATLGLPARLGRRAMAEGLICYPAGGSADGRDGAHILLAPPFIYTEDHVEELVTRLGRTLRDLEAR